MGHRVEFAQERNGFQVFVTAVFVGDPVTCFAGIVQIQHGGHGVDPQTIQMEFFQPINGTADQEIADFVAAIVVDQGTPIPMFTQPGILMLIERCAIKPSQTVGVLGKVRRHPVQDDSDIVLVAVVYEPAEIVWRTIAAGRREIAGGLITPGAIERMLGDRQ